MLHQGHILSPAVVKINGDVGVLAVGDLAGAVMDQGVPDGLPFAVGVQPPSIWVAAVDALHRKSWGRWS